MNLVIDIGNSLVKLGVFNNRELQFHWSTESLTPGALTKLHDQYTFHHCIVSTVSDLPAWLRLFISRFDKSIVLDGSTRLPVTINYATPQTLGNDRRALACAGHKRFPGSNVLIIGLGTAITYDLVDLKGHYLGGGISPGLTMRYNALHTFTKNLPLITCRKPVDHYLGKSTHDSVTAGVTGGIRGELDHFIDLYQSDFSPLTIVLTGGDASLFDKSLKNNIFAIPNMVLHGLNEILDFNA